MKQGISLIAVLMFMLAATTSSIVLYKWLGSENFASGARLKHSEAYQASESGFDAVRAWLSFKAADVGDVLRQHFEEGKIPFHLNEVQLGKLLDDEKKQNFEVYFLGADITKKPYKLKFMSVGTGRDGSEVKQTAIFNVEGLYNLKIPLSRGGIVDLGQFWGNAGTMGTIKAMNVVITQLDSIKNAGGQGLNTIHIGDVNTPGYLILDGNYYVNGGMNIYGDAYVTGDFDFCPTGGAANNYINGYLYVGGVFHPKGGLNVREDAFFNGGINPNASINDATDVTVGTGGCTGGANGLIEVKKNSTIGGDFFYYSRTGGGGFGFHVEGNLVMNEGEIILKRQSGNNKDSLSAYGNVYVKNALKGPIRDILDATNQDVAGTEPIPFFGQNTNSDVCVGGNWQEDNYNTNYNWWSYEEPYYENSTEPYKKIRIRTKSSKGVSQTSCNYENWGADPLDGTKNNAKDLKVKLEEGGGVGEKSCENTPIKFDTSLYRIVKEDDPPNWVRRADKLGNCGYWSSEQQKNILRLTDPGWVELGEELQACRNKSSGELYRDEWLVIYIKDKSNFNSTTALSSGKYIIILDIQDASKLNSNLYLPPTGDAQVMLYLPNGFPSGSNNYKIELAGGTGTDDKYNYFIFSDKDISQFNTTNSRKLTGNVFMNKCSVMNIAKSSQNPDFNAQSNPGLVEELMEFDIIQKNEGPTCPEDEICEPQPPTSITKQDEYIIPLSPRLKVELESKYISKEKEPEDEAENVKENILAMPRLLRLPSTAFSQPGITLSSYYNLLYLNGATKPESADATKPTPSCTCIGNPCTNGATMNTSSPEAGIYECKFSEGKISNFYVRIGAAPSSSTGSE
jgi:hypothetical protein